MKKKLLALVLVAALICVSVVTGTMAYLTDSEEATNVFAVGNVDVKMTTDASVHKYNAEGAEIDGKVTVDGETVKFNKIIPTNYMKRQMTITNDGDVPAYVRVLVVMNNVDAGYKAFEKYSDAALTSMYEIVYDGWNVSVDTATKKITGISDLTGILHVDYAENLNGVLEEVSDWNNADYGTLIGSDERVFAYYLKLDAKASKTLFNGLMAPGEFDNEQIKMFEGLKVEVYADAIQADGFDYKKEDGEIVNGEYLDPTVPADAEEIAKRAFDALDDAHPMNKMRVVVDLPAAGVNEIAEPAAINDAFDLGAYLPTGVESADVVTYALQFNATETSADLVDKEYKDWNADFVLTFDKDIPNGHKLADELGKVPTDSDYNDYYNFNDKVVLIGSYANAGTYPLPLTGDIKADEQIRVMKVLNKMLEVDENTLWSYEFIVSFVEDFKCGVIYNLGGELGTCDADPDKILEGVTATLELRLYEVVDGAETGRSFTVATYEYTHSYND